MLWLDPEMNHVLNSANHRSCLSTPRTRQYDERRVDWAKNGLSLALIEPTCVREEGRVGSRDASHISGDDLLLGGMIEVVHLD